MDVARKAIEDGTSLNAASQGVIITFNKILDPTSVVRESEYARSGEGQSFVQGLEGMVQKFQKGGAGLTIEGLEEFVSTGEEFMKGYQESLQTSRQLALNRSNKYDLAIEDFLPDGEIAQLKEEAKAGIEDVAPQETAEIEFTGTDSVSAEEFLKANKVPITQANIEFLLTQSGVGEEPKTAEATINPATTTTGTIRPKEEVAAVEPLQASQASSSASEFIAKEEGFREEAYQDSAGVWTIGFGTTKIGNTPVKEGDTISEAGAQKEINQEINRLEAVVDKEFGNNINEFQKIALTSFMYNLGMNIFDKPEAQKLKEAIKAGDVDTIRDQWVQYINAGGTPIAGLQNRRERELAQFLTTIV
jgi:lysozyme